MKLASVHCFPRRVPDDPFYAPRPPLSLPPAMLAPPPLPDRMQIGAREYCYALLLNPFYPKSPHGSFGKHVLTPSLALTSIAGATPPRWRVKYWDENLLQGPPPAKPMPQAVGITVQLTFAERAYELARWYRSHGAKVILGGMHVQSCADEAAPHCDTIALGDGVELWPRILNDLEAGRLQSRYEADYHRDYDADPPPRRDLLDRAAILTTSSLIATRGCHNRCGFCYMSTQGLHMPYRIHSVENVQKQIAAAGEPYVVFTDNNLGADKNYLRALCKGLRTLQIIWSAAVTLDVTDNVQLVREMALAGCTGVFIGFESLSDDNLAQARKRGPRTEEFARRVRIFHEYGISVNGSFVLGFDSDYKDVFQNTLQWIESNRLECSTFHILTPYPGTPLFCQFEAEGRLLHRDWSRYDTAHVVFQPKHMSPEDLSLGYDWLYRKLFSSASIWRRRPTVAGQVLPYLFMCYLYKRSNWLWPLLIKHRLVHALWHPFVEFSRRKHLKYRRQIVHEFPPEPIPIHAHDDTLLPEILLPIDEPEETTVSNQT